MIFKETPLAGAYIIDVHKLDDERGFFGRSFCKTEFESHGLNAGIVQANISHNQKKGTLRGLHMQKAPFEETKLVRCTRGAIYDVIVDLRAQSATFRQWIGVELTSRNYRMLYVPQGFAHGYITLEDDSEITYQVTQVYNAGVERGYRWDDPAFGITWPLQPLFISAKDSNHPLLETRAA
ncbi:MAG TPA: dTDP-4-dehydrorhamnose 3,5-epimerase [Niastella sp.]|nr:dTDP-4-dehydrorhamnose 3,5-epimerase [Niastella sp.]